MDRLQHNLQPHTASNKIHPVLCRVTHIEGPTLNLACRSCKPWQCISYYPTQPTRALLLGSDNFVGSSWKKTWRKYLFFIVFSSDRTVDTVCCADPSPSQEPFLTYLSMSCSKKSRNERDSINIYIYNMT